MGKERNKKGKKHRVTKPTGLTDPKTPKNKEVEVGEKEANASGSLQQMAGSTSSVTRSTACTTFGMLFEGICHRAEDPNAQGKSKKIRADRVALKQLLDQGTPGLLCGILCVDPEATVRAQAASSIKSLLGSLKILNDSSVIEELSQAGMSSSLITSIQQSLEGVRSAIGGGATTTVLITQTNILERSLAASVLLIQNASSALHEFMSTNVIMQLLSLLEGMSSEVLELEGIAGLLRRVALMVQKCLEGNHDLALQFSQAPNGVVCGSDTLVRVLKQLSSAVFSDADIAAKISVTCIHLSGAVVNIHRSLAGSENEAVTASTISTVLSFLVSQLNIEALPVLPVVEGIAPEAPAEEGFVPILSENEQAVRAAWSASCTRFVLVIEVLNDLASGFDSVDEGFKEGEEWESDDEEGMEQYATAQGSQAASGAESLKRTSHMKCLAYLEEQGAALVLISFLESLSTVFFASRGIRLPDHLPLLIDVCDVRTLLCLALNNLLAAKRRPSETSVVWIRLVTLMKTGLEEVPQTRTEASIDCLAALASVMYTCLGADLNYPTIETDKQEDTPVAVATLLEQLTKVPYPEVQLHAVRCLGLLGKRWLGCEASCDSLGPAVATVLLSCLDDASPLVVSEALDTIMDVFSEDDMFLHKLYLSSECQTKVTQAHSALRAKIRADKAEGLDREAVAHIKEVLLNTSRFLKYKMKFPNEVVAVHKVRSN